MPEKMVSDYINTLVPFGVLVVNSALFGILRGFLGKPLDPHVVQWAILEFVATMEICVDCAELDVIFEVHGAIVYGLTLFILCLWWGNTWHKACASPCEPLEDLVLRQDFIQTIAARLVGQIIAIKLAYRYAFLIWSYHLTPEHTLFHKAQFCETPLQVTVFWGFAVEAATTLISRFIALEISQIDRAREGFINAITTVVLVLAAMNSSGGFFNPALASALKFGCSGTGTWHFILVYWLGSITGSLVGRGMHMLIHKRPPQTDQPAVRRSSTPAGRNQHRPVNNRKYSQ